jgi:hypothetical protein
MGGAGAGLIQSPARNRLPGLSAFVEVGGFAYSQYPKSVYAATVLDPLIYLKAIPDARMGRRISYSFLVSAGGSGAVNPERLP